MITPNVMVELHTQVHPSQSSFFNQYEKEVNLIVIFTMYLLGIVFFVCMYKYFHARTLTFIFIEIVNKIN